MEQLNDWLSMVRATSAIEWLAVGSLIVYVSLMAKENILAWPMGILGSGLYCWICFSNQLFLDAILQVFYVIFGLYGWLLWRHKKHDFSIHTVSIQRHFLFIAIGFLLVIVLGYLADTFTSQASPYVDGFIFVFSLIATYMTAQKMIENWVYWIIIDAVAVGLFYSKDLYLTSGLYVLYTILSFIGLITWKKEYTRQL